MIENVHFPPLGPPGPTENDFLMRVVVMFVLEMLGARSNTTLQILSIWGVPLPPPLRTKFLAKREYPIWGVPPSPPLRTKSAK